MTLQEANNELQRRCNGLSNANHVLQVALQMQKEIFKSFGASNTCDDCKHYGKNKIGFNPRYCNVIRKFKDGHETCFNYKPKDTK